MPSSDQTLKSIGEFGFIDLITKLTKIHRGVIKGIGDDTAVIASQGNNLLLLTTDMLAEGVHFTKNMYARLIGHKAMACSISDIAAMGGMPLAAVISIGMPPDTKIAFAKELYQGMEQLARRFRFSIVGGDTIANRSIVINVALLGTAKKDNVVYRSGAKQGDMIFLTGALGRSFHTQKHLIFSPCLAKSQFLTKNFPPTSMIDLSDGLAGDLGHILKESRVGAVIYEKLIPKTSGANIQNVLFEGEDFELLFTLSPALGRKLISRKIKPRSFYYIGDILGAKDGFSIIKKDGRGLKLNPKSFSHF